LETKIILFVYNIMKGGNTDSKAPEVQGFDYDNVEQYGTVNMTGGKRKVKKGKSKSSKFSDFDFEKEWKEFETSYNQKYGGASKKKKTSSTKKKPTKKTASSTKKKPTKKASSAKKPKRKTQRGGDEAGATFAPAQFFDANASMSAPSSDKSTGSIVDGLFPHAPNNPVVAQTGGAKKKSSKTKKPKTATKTTKPKKDTKKKDSKKDSKKTKTATKSTDKKVSVLDKIKKFFAM
jgi:hypothetical protein